MVWEIAVLEIDPNRDAEFEHALHEAVPRFNVPTDAAACRFNALSSNHTGIASSWTGTPWRTTSTVSGPPRTSHAGADWSDRSSPAHPRSNTPPDSTSVSRAFQANAVHTTKCPGRAARPAHRRPSLVWLCDMIGDQSHLAATEIPKDLGAVNSQPRLTLAVNSRMGRAVQACSLGHRAGLLGTTSQGVCIW